MLFERVRLMAVPAFGLLATSYLVMLIDVSLASEERVLGLNQPNASVARIWTATGLSPSSGWSGMVTATVRDDAGRRYRRATHAEGMLDPEGGSIGIADTPLRPGLHAKTTLP